MVFWGSKWRHFSNPSPRSQIGRVRSRCSAVFRLSIGGFRDLFRASSVPLVLASSELPPAAPRIRQNAPKIRRDPLGNAPHSLEMLRQGEVTSGGDAGEKAPDSSEDDVRQETTSAVQTGSDGKRQNARASRTRMPQAILHLQVVELVLEDLQFRL